MHDFGSYFEEEAIVKLLCKMRVRAAKAIHKAQMLRAGSTSANSLRSLAAVQSRPDFIELSRILPPRRHWKRPRLIERKSVSDPQKLLQQAIWRAYLEEKRNVGNGEPPKAWYLGLLSFTLQLQERISGVSPNKIRTPSIVAFPKGEGKAAKSFRPISNFTLSDRVIIGLTARYFTDIFDSCFLDSSYAFRSTQRGKSRTHQDAVETILKYRLENLDSRVWIAEGDIEKFFDCANHSAILAKVHILAKQAELDLDPRALSILRQYLLSYSFPQNVLPLDSAPDFWRGKPKGSRFTWPKEKLEEQYYRDGVEGVRIGIPQGGALSCFISNLLLHFADVAVDAKGHSKLVYARFCDDMVIVSTDREELVAALDRYLAATRDLKLLVHDPVPTDRYLAEFWESKSKSPYPWAPKSNGIPWLSFVGFQIRYDGQLRIRKQSLRKEMRKQRRETQFVIDSLTRKNASANSRKTLHQQLHALESRLVSMAVGKKSLANPTKKQPQCWGAGFDLLAKYPSAHIDSQLRMLDRSRELQLRRAAFHLRSLEKESPDAPKGRLVRFYGRPFSYQSLVPTARSREMVGRSIPDQQEDD
jgi:retron-type reverse transcriptase